MKNTTFLNKGFWEVIDNRRSIRRYIDRPVADDILQKIIGAGVKAPSAHNLQPWHYVVCRRKERIHALAEKMAEKYEADMKVQNVPPDVRERKTARSLYLFKNAPVLVFIFDMKSGEMHLTEEERIMNVQSVAVSAGYMLLAAVSFGIGACWYSAPLFCRDVINPMLRVPEQWRPQALITLGYPEEAPRQRTKAPIEEKVTYAC